MVPAGCISLITTKLSEVGLACQLGGSAGTHAGTDRPCCSTISEPTKAALYRNPDIILSVASPHVHRPNPRGSAVPEAARRLALMQINAVITHIHDFATHERATVF